MKKSITTLLAITMCLSLFGCGAKQQAAEIPSTVEPSETVADTLENNTVESKKPEVTAVPSETEDTAATKANVPEETDKGENKETETPSTTPETTKEPTVTDSVKETQQAMDTVVKQEQEIPSTGNTDIEKNEEPKNNQRDTYVTDSTGTTYYIDNNGDYWLVDDIAGMTEASGEEYIPDPEDTFSFYEAYGFAEGSLEHFYYLLDGGENPLNHGFSVTATDTGRKLTPEEFWNWYKAGYDPETDDYLDSEHEQGLY